MDLRTKVHIPGQDVRISYSDPVMFIGSCFASEMGSKMKEGAMPVMINPAGTVYNPVSVAETLRIIMQEKEFTREDIYCYKDTWLSFSHYTDFSSHDPETIIRKINRSTKEASGFMKKAKYLFITFGTSWIYRLAENGRPVSNCHKLPASFFTRELLTVENITQVWTDLLSGINERWPEVKIIFTVSPVRHWKDGAHGNQVSKSTLLLAIENLLNHPAAPGYFPAYEIMMDELRDYRFYEKDMLHPSETAVEFIWELFSGVWIGKESMKIWTEASAVTKATRHRLTGDSDQKTWEFAAGMLDKISKLHSKYKFIDLASQRSYFENLLNSRQE
jgi:hypothetical protein